MVRVVLAVWHLEEEFAEDLALVASELVTNAAVHARGNLVRMTLTRTEPKRVRVGVTDQDRRVPYLPPVEVLATSGRGLRMVESLADGWGYTSYRWGKQVWAEVGR